MKFYGKMTTAWHSSHYYISTGKAVTFEGVDYFGWKKFCSGFGEICLGGKYYDKERSSACDWGYYGVGSLKTAALMLLYYLRGVSTDNYTTVGEWYIGDGTEDNTEGMITPAEHEFINKYTDDFCREVIAKLPDSWSIDHRDIREWIECKANGQPTPKEIWKPISY